MTTPSNTPTNSQNPVVISRVGELQPVRYRLPAGLADEILREAQRRNISPSRVVTAVLAHGLSSFAAAGVADRLERAIQSCVSAAPTAETAEGLSVVAPTAAPIHPLENRHV